MTKPKRQPKAVAKADAEARRKRGRSRPGVSMPTWPSAAEMPPTYGKLLADLKQRIGTERLRVVMSSNAGMVLLYWEIGKAILKRHKNEGWGAKVIDRLSADLREAFPDMQGLSPRNLKYMRKSAESWPDREVVQRSIAQLPWRSNLALIEKIAGQDDRLWYARQTVENGWSREILELQIESGFVKPIGVADWKEQLTETLPDELKSSLPSVEEIEAELNPVVKKRTARKQPRRKFKS
jgi:predicted nuclease of restriction endonuclease-like (RecB) superfamily